MKPLTIPEDVELDEHEMEPFCVNGNQNGKSTVGDHSHDEAHALRKTSKCRKFYRANGSTITLLGILLLAIACICASQMETFKNGLTGEVTSKPSDVVQSDESLDAMCEHGTKDDEVPDSKVSTAPQSSPH